MSALKKALTDAEMTQAQLADALGVTPVAVNHWVNGRAPIPEDRAYQIQELLNVDMDEVTVDYSTIWHQGRTPVGYAILFPLKCPLEGFNALGVKPRSPEDFRRRVTLWARHLGIPRGRVEAAIMGRGLLEPEYLVKVAEGAVPALNPAQFAAQAGFKASETQALQQTLKEAQDDITFAMAIERLKAGRDEWLGQGLRPDKKRAFEVLDNGQPLEDLDWWLIGLDAPEEFEDTVEARRTEVQDLSGRFRSAG